MNTEHARREILTAAATIVDDMTVTDVEPGHWMQIGIDTELAKRLRALALREHSAVPPVGSNGRRAALHLTEPYQAILRYLRHLEDSDIHHVKVSIGDDGEVTWRERGEAMLAEFLPTVEVKDKRVLAVGVNSGGDVAALLAAGAEHVTGLEMIPELASLCSALLIVGGADPARWRILHGDIEEFEQTEAFDLIYNVGVLYHVENPLRVLRRCFNALRPGGMLALETEVIKPRHGEQGCADVICWPLREPGYVKRGQNWPTWWIPSEDALRLMLRASGFKDVTRIPDTKVAKTAFTARKP